MSKKWGKIISFDKVSVNTALNGAEISDGELQKALDVIFDNGVAERGPGRSAIGSAHTSGARIDGVFRSFNDLGNNVLLRVCNGEIERYTGSAWTDVQTGLTATVPYDFLNVGNKTVIVNGYDDAREFDPRTNAIQKLGLEPPRFYKKVAYFETDETDIWSLGSGHVFNTVFYRTEERTGNSKRSLYITAGAGATVTSTLTYASAQDFSQYANAKSISNDDAFCISILHRERDYIDAIYVDFITSTNNYYRLTIDGTELDPVNARDNVWTHIAAKKSRFAATGSPSWSNITKFAVSMVGQTSTAEAYVDNCYWKNAKIEAVKYKKVIDNFEGAASGWTVTNGALVDNMLEAKIKGGTKSAKVTRTNTPTTIVKTVSAIDLSQFIDGVSSQTSDEVAIWMYAESTANLTSVQLLLYSDVTPGSEKYFHRTFTVAGSDINKTTTGAWTQLKDAKSDFTDVGTASWSAIIKISIVIVSTGAINLYFDDWCLQEQTLSLSLATMENSETWVWGTAGSGGFSTNPNYLIEGDSSIYVKVPNKQAYNISHTEASAVNLNQFSTGVASGTSDIIAFWLYWTRFAYINSIKLQIDCNAGDFATDYYEAEIFPIDLSTILNLTGKGAKDLNNKSCEVEIEKADFIKVGDTAGKDWSTVIAYRFVVTTTDQARFGLTVYFDNLHMRRRRGLSGVYQWCCVFKNADGVNSGMSEWSNLTTFEGTKALLRLLPTSADTNVSERAFYRRGGSLGEDARLDFTIYDNTTTEYFSEISDDLLGELLLSTQVPNGTIRVPLGAKWGPKFKGEYILYRDPSNLKRAYYSLPDKVWGWSELQAWDFDSELLDVFVVDNVCYFNTKNGIRALSKPMSQATFEDYRETGLIKHSMGPWASCDVEGRRAVASYDGIHIFDGTGFDYISEPVKDKFDSSTYDLDSAILFYRKRHLYVSIITTGGTRSLLDFYMGVPGNPKAIWRTSAYVIQAFCVLQGIGDNNEIYVGDRSGNVYQFDTGYVASSEIITKDYQADPTDPFQEVVLEEIYVMARSVSSTPGLINVQFRMNQTLNGDITVSFPASGNMASTYTLYYASLLAVQNYLKGNKVGLDITLGTDSKHFAIQAIKLIGTISPMPETLEV